MANLLFFEVLRLTFLYKVYETSSTASDYAKRTIVRPMSSPFSMRDTEIKGLLAYFQDINKNKNLSKNDQIFLNKIDIDVQMVFNYIRRMMNLQELGTISQVTLRHLQKDLAVDDPKLRAMLTLVVKWETLTGDEMRLLIERIKNYGLLHLRNSELTKVINRFAKDKKMSHKNDDRKITPMDVLLGLAAGMAAKGAHDSRARNAKSFSRLKSDTKVGDYESPRK